MSDLKFLINSRKFLRKSITELFNKKDSFESFSDCEKSQTRAKLQEYLNKVDSLNSRIQELKWQEEEDEKEHEREFIACEEYSEKLRTCLALLEEKALGPYPMETARSLLKSPVAPLPTFKSTEGEDLDKFFNDFEKACHMFNYNDYDKFLLLTQQVSGRASILLKSLESDKRGYVHAKKLLLDALASLDARKFDVIKRLSEMDMPIGSDPFEFVSKMTTLTEASGNLDLQRDDFLRFFFWRGMNNKFKHHMILSTGSSNPSLQELNASFFDTCNRYQLAQYNYKFDKSKDSKKQDYAKTEGKFKHYSSTTAHAVKVSYERSFKPCSICTKLEGHDASHPIYKCQKFSTAKEKTEKLKSLGGCLKCSGLNHKTEFCKYSFNIRCKHCQKWHFGFLCVECPRSDENFGAKMAEKSASENTKTNKNKKSKETSSNLVIISEVLKGNIDNDFTILPTFTCKLNESNIRCLKDSGCQSNLILESVANFHKLKTIKNNVRLIINGINTSQKYDTRIVEVPININDEIKTVQALCIPVIKIVLDLPGLGRVVRGFIEKGHKLADESLLERSNKITNIMFILGSKSSFCMPEKDIVFGQNGHSMYSETPLGTMLKGDVDTYLQDLEYLQSGYAHSISDSQVSIPNSDYVGEITSLLSYTQPPPVANINIIDAKGKIIESELEKATNQVLETSCTYHTNYDTEEYEVERVELNNKLITYCLDNTTRNGEGRLRMPLLWSAKVAHLLGENRRLAELVLKSNLKKLSKNPLHLELMDQAFKEQEAAGIIERVDNLKHFLEENPGHSFLPHMGVFKLDRETTKCRPVFLSNICERDPNKRLTVSHNQALHAGPCLNQKISSSLLHMRFDEKLLIFDICKAFNQVELYDIDSNRLLFLWYRNPCKKDFTVVCYRNVRLSFGLRCSPTILLLGLYKILVLDAEDDSENLRQLKSLIYSLCYMDNCGVSANTTNELLWAYNQLSQIFSPYKISLQQFYSNDQSLQSLIDANSQEESPAVVKVLGLQWDRNTDTLSTKPLQLNPEAKTKREILSSIASQFDLYNFNGPILNRSRLFMHELQCNKQLGWDEKLHPDLIREWKNITKQTNASPVIQIERFVGRRDGKYRLLAFSDSSKVMYGVVIFILDEETNDVHFLMAKNRIINTQLKNKSMPSLEMQGITLATECIIELSSELSGPTCLHPINISGLEVYSDSLVALSWINASTNKLEKMQKKAVFVLNRINRINKLCEKSKVKFSFVSGMENPADAITRPFSYKSLMKSNFLVGPQFLKNPHSPALSRGDLLSFTVPNPNSALDEDLVHAISERSTTDFTASLKCSDKGTEFFALQIKYSSFNKLTRVCRYVLEFVNKLKSKLKLKHPNVYDHLRIINEQDLMGTAIKHLISQNQYEHFPDIFNYFDKKTKTLPDLVGQLNVYVGQDGLLRVRSKCDRLKGGNTFPLLIAKESVLVPLIIRDIHKKLGHAGCYSVLSELRKRFYIPHFFSVVRKILKTCITCKRFNARTLKLNQSPYKDWRVNPPEIPYKYVFMDYLGPYKAKINGQTSKVYVLCITCIWSRSINLQVCLDLTNKEFLRAFQIHCFEYGLPEYCITDLGSQFVSCSNIILNYFNDPDTQIYFQQNGIRFFKFEQFYKGHSQLGAMVEICVKMVKRLVYGAIKNIILSFRDFEFIISQTIHLVNRRPIAFQEALRDIPGDDVPIPITPEKLTKGYELPSINVIPELHDDNLEEWTPSNPVTKIKDEYKQLRKVRNELIKVYHEEFIAVLIKQAVNKGDRYKPVSHLGLQLGDLVLIKETNTKPMNYPMGTVKSVLRNDLGEVTGAKILKGNKELVQRHSSVIIPILRIEEQSSAHSLSNNGNVGSKEETKNIAKEKRRAAIESGKKTKVLFQKDLV